MSGAIDGVVQGIKDLNSWWNRTRPKLEQGWDNFWGIDGSHADGLSYVPWDGYIAQLHKGEAVLTADQAAAMRQLASASAPAPTAVTAGELRQVTASAVNALGTIGGPSGGTYKIILQMNVNGKEFYRETIDDFRAVDRERPEVQDDI